MVHFLLFLGRKIWGIIIGPNTVHIPLHVSNIGGGENLSHLLRHAIHHFRITEVQDALVAAFGMILARNSQGPIRMGAIQVTVYVDHLRLYPDTKLHTNSVDLVCQALQAVWKLLGIDYPISQGALIVATLTEPTVVHNEELHAGFLALLGKSNQLALINVKIIGFPAI